MDNTSDTAALTEALRSLEGTLRQHMVVLGRMTTAPVTATSATPAASKAVSNIARRETGLPSLASNPTEDGQEINEKVTSFCQSLLNISIVMVIQDIVQMHIYIILYPATIWMGSKYREKYISAK